MKKLIYFRSHAFLKNVKRKTQHYQIDNGYNHPITGL